MVYPCIYQPGYKLHSPLITGDTIKSTAIILKLVEPLLVQCQTVWIDNFYNSLSLGETLKIIHKKDHVGTLKLT
jgi:phage gp46-like protein